MTSQLKVYQKTKNTVKPQTIDKDDIVTYLPLVKHVAMRIYQRTPPNIELDDLISYGIIGLMDAYKKYNHEKNAEFKTYAEFRVRGAILDELRAKDWVPRSVRDKAKKLDETCVNLEQRLGHTPDEQEICGELNLTIEEYHKYLNDIKSVTFLSLDEIFDTSDSSGDRHFEIQISDESSPNPFTVTEKNELKKIIVDVLDEMNEKERMVITLYYYEELTFKEIGLVMGITESYASQIHSHAILKLKTKLKKRNLQTFSP